GEAILARTPALSSVADVVAIDRGRTPASHFTIGDLVGLWSVIREAADDRATDGVVVVQGTDTIEETAFCWDLLHDGPKPVVVTGAMRSSTEAGYAGPRPGSARGASWSQPLAAATPRSGSSRLPSGRSGAGSRSRWQAGCRPDGSAAGMRSRAGTRTGSARERYRQVPSAARRRGSRCRSA